MVGVFTSYIGILSIFIQAFLLPIVSKKYKEDQIVKICTIIIVIDFALLALSTDLW
jgi:hypothetical protein